MVDYQLTPEGVFDPQGMPVRGSAPSKPTGLSVVYSRTAGLPKGVSRPRELPVYYFLARSAAHASGPVASRWTATILKNHNPSDDTGVFFENYSSGSSVSRLAATVAETRFASPILEFKHLNLPTLKTSHVYYAASNLTRVSAVLSSAAGAHLTYDEIDFGENDPSIGYVLQFNKRMYHRGVCDKVNTKTAKMWKQAHGRSPFIVAGWSVLLGIAPCEHCNPMGLTTGVRVG